MSNILEYLNRNPGVGIIIAGIAALISVVGWFLKKKQSVPIPELHLQLYGSGAKKQIEGHIEKEGGQTLVVDTIDINGCKTTLNQQFTKLFYLKSLDIPNDLFTAEIKFIFVKVTYRTLDGQKFEYSQEMQQEKRVDNIFNVKLIGTPTVRALKII